MTRIDRFLDIQKQGFMKPAKTRKPKKEPPTVRCTDCQNWHQENKHTASPEVRRANRKMQVLGYRASVKGPGRFKGEAPYVPYFWDAVMDGRAEENGGVLTFAVTSKDGAMFPELRQRAHVCIYEENGFVREDKTRAPARGRR